MQQRLPEILLVLFGFLFPLVFLKLKSQFLAQSVVTVNCTAALCHFNAVLSQTVGCHFAHLQEELKQNFSRMFIDMER